MKKYLSVFMLIVRYSFYGVLGIFLGMILTQAGFFWLFGMDEGDLFQALTSTPFVGMFVPTIILLTGILGGALCSRGGQLTNLMRRLRISDKTAFWLQAAYNALVFALYFAVQALLFLGLSAWYAQVHPEAVNHQTLFVTAYQHPLFHMVFPLENGLGWVCNCVLIAGLGICTAAYPFRQRRGRRSFTTFLMVLLVLFYKFLMGVEHQLGISAAIYCIPAALLFMGSSLAGVLGIEEEVYE